jgi:O-acetyl-ADP-ribose deacetylase (regulator of RNase III)
VALLIRVEQGDMSSFQGDGVVNAANNHLRMGSGVAGALRKRGGPTIQAECDEHIRKNGPLQVGEAAATGAGNLLCRWVIHAAAMGDSPPSADSIRSSTREALGLAVRHGMNSLAFPVLGSGVGGFSFEQAVRLMLDEIHAHAEHSSLPGIVVLYGYTEEDAATVRRLTTST